MSDGLRVAYIVPEFPKLSETAILNEVLGLLDAGVDLRVFSFVRPREKVRHDRANDPALRSYVTYVKRFGWGHGRGWAAVRSIWCIVRYPNQSAQIRERMCEHKIPTRYLSGLSYLSDFLRAVDPHVVHVQFGHVARFIAPLTDYLGLRLVTSFRGWDASCFPAKAPQAYVSLFRSCEYILVRCESMADDLAAFGCPRGKIIVHHSGIELSRFPMTSRPEVKNGQIRVLTVGRLVDKKGMPAAVGAVRRCLKEFPGVVLRILGGGPKEDDIRQLVKNLHMEKNVEFLGEKPQDAVAGEMAESHLFVLPSQVGWDGDKEGIPNSIMEAMASGLPVLSTKHAGIPECVKDGRSGLLVREKDVDALGNAMLTLLKAPDRWEEMGRAGRRRIEEEFDIRKQTERLIDIYLKIRNSRSEIRKP